MRNLVGAAQIRLPRLPPCAPSETSGETDLLRQLVLECEVKGNSYGTSKLAIKERIGTTLQIKRVRTHHTSLLVLPSRHTSTLSERPEFQINLLINLIYGL